MLLFDEIPQPLTWYDEIEKQGRFQSGYESHMYDLLVEYDRILPFQIRFALDETLRTFQLYSVHGVKIADLAISQFKRVVLTELDFNYYIWTADYALKTTGGENLALSCGQLYYLKISTEHAEYFSEIFTSFRDIDKYLMIEWADEHNVDPVYYLGEFGFRFRFFVDTFITKGKPAIVIESEEDGHGEIIDISRKVQITYDIDLGIVPNFVYEAIAFMAIHRDITITTPNNLREGSIKNVSLEESQIDGLAYWQLIVNFQQGRYFYNTACGHEIQPVDSEEYIIDQGATEETFDTFIEQQDLS